MNLRYIMLRKVIKKSKIRGNSDENRPGITEIERERKVENKPVEKWNRDRKEEIRPDR